MDSGYNEPVVLWLTLEKDVRPRLRAASTPEKIRLHAGRLKSEERKGRRVQHFPETKETLYFFGS